MPFAEAAFSTLGPTRIREGRRIGPEDLRDVDLLAIRSTTRVDRSLLEGTPVRFVGTATIGTDHMDLAYLDSAGIRWCYAPGCNAQSVAEYVTAVLLALAVRHRFALAGLTLGVIGVGQVGRRVVQQARALGLRVLQNDPPREEAEFGTAPTSPQNPFTSLDQVLAESDIVTLHVPLTRQGRHATWHLADRPFFERLKPGAILINAARGAVINTDALMEALDRGTIRHTVIDCWEGEPDYRRDLLARANLATPHIAGHSFEGKAVGTEMVYREACRFLGVDPLWHLEGALPPPPVPRVVVEASGRTDEEVLWEAVRAVYNPEEDDRRFREAASRDMGGRHFDRLREEYPIRREFRFTQVVLREGTESTRAALVGLGFARVGCHPAEDRVSEPEPRAEDRGRRQEGNRGRGL